MIQENNICILLNLPEEIPNTRNLFVVFSLALKGYSCRPGWSVCLYGAPWRKSRCLQEARADGMHVMLCGKCDCVWFKCFQMHEPAGCFLHSYATGHASRFSPSNSERIPAERPSLNVFWDTLDSLLYSNPSEHQACVRYTCMQTITHKQCKAKMKGAGMHIIAKN